MKLIDFSDNAFGIIAIGGQATGVIAIGQVANGVVAIGQIATGVFAFGQLARGGFVVGQLAIGLVSVGMLGVGVFWSGAMLGVAGRGKGLVLPLIPASRRSAGLPPLESARQRVARGLPGWSPLRLHPAPDSLVEIHDGKGPIQGLRLDAGLRKAACAEVHGGPAHLLGRIERRGDDLVVTELDRLPPGGSGWFTLALSLVPRFLALVAVAALVTVVALVPLNDLLVPLFTPFLAPLGLGR